MLDRKEQELREKTVEFRHRQLEDRRREQQAEVQKLEQENLKDMWDRQAQKISGLTERIYNNVSALN